MSLEKVAKLAGVSNSTVSRVINHHPRVAPETAKAVREAMEQLQYTPSDRRPGPKPSSTRPRQPTLSIAFLVLGTSRGSATPAFEDLLRGVSGAAADHDVKLAFAHLADPDELPRRLVDEKLDGLLLHGAMPEQQRERLRKLPSVWLMGNRRRPDFGDQVMPDTYEIGARAARHLVERGHERLAYLNLDAGHWSFTLTQHAFRTVALAESARHVETVDQPRGEAGGYWSPHTHESAERLADRFLALPSPRPTGLLIADDMQSAVLQPILQRKGIVLGPGKTEIVSVNNEKPYLLGLSPQPTVIDLRFESVGRRGVEQLLWRIGHADVNERIITAIEPDLIAANEQ